jgi:hypothetical protein
MVDQSRGADDAAPVAGSVATDDAGPRPRVLLYVRAGCHLCEAGREVVTAVAGELGVPVTEVDIDATPGMRSLFGELVPAVTVDGVLVDHWRIDPLRLRRALVGEGR